MKSIVLLLLRLALTFQVDNIQKRVLSNPPYSAALNHTQSEPHIISVGADSRED